MKATQIKTLVVSQFRVDPHYHIILASSYHLQIGGRFLVSADRAVLAARTGSGRMR
jgi:hypothetical protein